MSDKTSKEEALKEFTDQVQEQGGFGRGFGSTKWPDVNVADLAADFGVTGGNPGVIGGDDFVYKRKILAKHLIGFVEAGRLPALDLIRFESTGEITERSNFLLVELLGAGLVNQHLVHLQKELIAKAYKVTETKVPWYKRIFRRKTKS